MAATLRALTLWESPRQQQIKVRIAMIDDLYPVPNRPALLNLRIAAHEIGHCVSARVIGSYVHSVSIVPGNGYEGRCVRSGPPSALNLASPVPEDETVEILSVCERLEQIMPEAGDSRIECSEFYIRAQCSMIELVAGRPARLLASLARSRTRSVRCFNMLRPKRGRY